MHQGRVYETRGTQCTNVTHRHALIAEARHMLWCLVHECMFINRKRVLEGIVDQTVHCCGLIITNEASKPHASSLVPRPHPLSRGEGSGAIFGVC